MTVSEILLQKLAEWRPAAGRAFLSATDEASGWSVTVTADERTSIGCQVWELQVQRAKKPEGAVLDLQSWADQIARRATGLLENLRVVEVDVLRNQAQLRSDEPAQRGGDVFYYELLLTGTEDALLRRYHAGCDGQARRQQVAFAITHEALAKLVSEITAK
jgi:hypothetical protein